jgi:hypothetical protein
VAAEEQDKVVDQVHPGKVTPVEQDELKVAILAVAVAVVQEQQVQMPYHLKAETVALVYKVLSQEQILIMPAAVAV